jgi:hypothetical protein
MVLAAGLVTPADFAGLRVRPFALHQQEPIRPGSGPIDRSAR